MRLLIAIVQSIVRVELQCKLVVAITGFLYNKLLLFAVSVRKIPKYTDHEKKDRTFRSTTHEVLNQISRSSRISRYKISRNVPRGSLHDTRFFL